MKKYWKIVVPVIIGVASLSLHFLSVDDSALGPGFIFDMRELLGKTLTDKNIQEYARLLGPFVKKSKRGILPAVKGELQDFDFGNGRLETIDGMIYGVWYLFDSSFASLNGFKPVRPPVSGKDTLLKSFGFPSENKNFSSNNRAFVWEDEFNIRQLQLFREPAGGNTIVSIRAYLMIPWEGLGSFHKKMPKKPEYLKKDTGKEI